MVAQGTIPLMEGVITFDGFVLQEGADMLHRNLTALWVARTIGKKESIKVQTIEVIVPRNPDNLDSTFEEATDDVCLYAAIDEDDARNLSPLSMD